MIDCRSVAMIHRNIAVRMELLSILTLLGSGHHTCMKLTSAECTVENSC
jgi:hypothetical protein